MSAKKSNPRKRKSSVSKFGGIGSKPIYIKTRSEKLKEMYERAKEVRATGCPFDV